jgi:hypothetical protein
MGHVSGGAAQDGRSYGSPAAREPRAFQCLGNDFVRLFRHTESAFVQGETAELSQLRL